MKNAKWTKGEIKKLFLMVENNKENNKSLLDAFSEYAKKFSRKTNSVRNFYYAQLKIFEKQPKLCQEFEIDLSKHQKQAQKFFSNEELEQSKKDINTLISKGYSVRRACQEVAGGDIQKMLRLQNKYQTEKHKQNMSNVLVMPTKKVGLSENDINSLFLGLVKLVKKNAEESIGENFNNQIKTANFELRKSIKELSEKEREVALLRKKFELLSSEKVKLKEEIRCLRSQNVELLKAEVNEQKMKGLKSYVKKLKRQPAVKS